MRKKHDNIRLYHVDHLGSTSLVTDIDGEITQHVAYIPYGEIFVEQRNGSWNTPYLFNAKELDEETGLYYYGARYLDPTHATWLSVDPLFEKYVGMTPYGYCAGNPVGLVDPTGMDGYYFNEDGTLNRVIPEKGEDYGYILRKDIRFTFADPNNDIPMALKEDFEGFEFITDEMINAALENSGAKESSQIPLYSYYYALRESAGVFDSDPSLDFKGFAIFSEDGSNILDEDGPGIDNEKKLYITFSGGKHVAHNAYNFGNFLWGGAMKCLDINFTIAVIGAHGHNYYFDPYSKGNLDSPDDQFSIKCGYMWANEHIGPKANDSILEKQFMSGTNIANFLWGNKEKNK